jgi:hypothetical protein
MHTPNPLKSPISLKLPSVRVRSSLAILAAALFAAQMLLAVQTPAAQTPATIPAPSPPHKAVHPHTRPGAVHAKTPPAQAAPVPIAPPAPELPHWPVNDKPAEAAVTWDSQGLRIEAANSSLRQILKDVSTATGAKVEGLGADERVFGAYGPGRARDVLSQLLQGCGYNVMMVGDLGQGTPRQIVLSSRHSGDTPNSANPSAASNSDDEDTDTDDQPQPPAQPLVPVPSRPGVGPGSPPRTPQQIMQEMQQQQQRTAPQ